MTGDRLTDLDYAIMGVLPNEGTRLGHHTYAKQVVTIAEELGGVTSAQCNGRLRSLKSQDMVVMVVVQPANRGMGWQVTQKGLNVLADRRSNQNMATVHRLPTAVRMA